MADVLAVVPEITAVLEHRTASSSCCGAKLSPGTVPGSFTCRGCGESCERVMSDPVEVTAHG